MTAMRYLLLLLLLAVPAKAQRLPPGTRIGVTKDAKAQLDSLAELARKTKVEHIACVTVSIMDDSVYVVAKIGKAKSDSADAVYIYGKPLEQCQWWQPSIHTHFDLPDEYLYNASPIDQHTAALRDIFGLVLSVTADSWKVKAYP